MFCSGGDKMRNASGHQCKVKISSSEKKKKVNDNTYGISSKQRVTSKKFLEFSRCSRAKQQRNVQKRRVARAKLLLR